MGATVWPALHLASWLADAGIFGSCREGNCAYGALIIGAPIIWAMLSALGILVWFRLRRGVAAHRKR